MQIIFGFDQQVFLFINHLPHSALLDQIALFFSAVGSWGAVWIGIAILLFFREEKRDHWFFLPAVLVSIGGLLSEFILKVLFARPRPTDLLSTYSFPSTHAVLAFAFAYILSREEPKFTRWFYLLATLISLSRIYLGVHYPLDVVAGALVGWGVGKISVKYGKMI